MTKKILFIVLFLYGVNAVVGQEVTVGSSIMCGSSLSSFVPASYSSWTASVSWSASIYNKSNFTTINGTITSIQYFVDCGSCNPYGVATNQEIYLGHITNGIFSNANRIDNDTNVTDLTLVYSGNVTWTDGGWNSITLDTPFNYDETKNLVVYYVNKHGGDLPGSFLCSNPGYIVDNFGGNTTKYARSSSSTLPTTGYLHNQGPVFKLSFSPSVSTPTITLPVNSSICAGTTFTFSSVTASDYSSLSWTTGGTGSFNDSTILNPTYTPSTADITNGTVTLTLTATNSSGSASENFTLTINTKPTASITKN